MSLQGYGGRALQLLREAKAGIGDIVKIEKNGERYEGILMPRVGKREDHIVIKLANGYCVGVKVVKGVKVERVKPGTKPTFVPPEKPISREELPEVSIISTGGTIAARVEYRTGAVHPALSAEDLYAVVPELSNIATINAEIVFSIFSENMTPSHWSETAKTIANHIERGTQGVVVAHGTDTMGYTAAALSFALQNLPVPVVLVGAQRSSDRPSSDAALNLIGAVIAAAKSPFAEVCLAMHDTISDKTVVLHRGTKVRKMHTSRRDTFKSINASPIAVVEEGRVKMLTNDYKKRDPKRKLILKPDFEAKVALLKSYPGLNPSIIKWHADQGYLGLILEGTGLGHVGEYCFNAVKYAIDKGLFVGMTSQCLFGRVNMKVYDTGRDLLAMGVTPLGDMLPETALVKLMWAFGQTKDLVEVRKLMLTNIAGEISPRTFI